MATRETNLINPNAEIVASSQCLMVNVTAARGLQQVLKTNLGPRGTLKMLVGGAGQIKITKDGNVLLHEMQIQHPTAMMIARAATAMDDEVGDGTTSSVVFIGELMKQAERYTSEGLHPRLITEGYEVARDMVLDFLDAYKAPKPDLLQDRETLIQVARSSLRTKLAQDIADNLAEAVVDAVVGIAPADGSDIDLHMVEILEMQHKSASDSQCIRGLVLDHGIRHPDMPHSLENVYILTCNVSMEYEKTEITSGFYYSNAEQREKLVESERKFTDEKVKQVIALKRELCPPGDTSKSFCVINQKGIDPVSLDMLAKEGIMALRRAKRRNMERLTLTCGGTAVNSFDDLEPSVLGYAGKVYEESLGEDKFTFVEDVAEGKSVTLLLKGPNKHTLDMLKDAARDGLRAVKLALEEKALVPGAGAFEIAAYRMLQRRKASVSGKARLGVEAFAQSLLAVPKILAENSGLDVQQAVLNVEEEQERQDDAGNPLAVGLDLTNGETLVPAVAGIWDTVRTKRQSLSLSTVLATQLLLVDEVMKAGKAMGKQAQPEMDEE